MRSTGVEDIKSLEYKHYPLVDRWAKAVLFKVFSSAKVGRLVFQEEEKIYCFGCESDETDLVAHIKIEKPSAYRTVLLNGSIGSAEAYIAGDWSTPDLLKVIRFFVANMETLSEMDGKRPLWQQGLLKFSHLLNKNSTHGSRKNISAHYDIGNDFFKLFLDKSMMYSAGIYPHSSASLEVASQYKLDHICRRLNLNEHDHLLEIGTGWGGLAIHAARHYGCKVTTTTISKEQFIYASNRVKQEGLEDRITLLEKDYRDLNGQYDKLVSVEMIEAVGHEYYARFFQQCSHLLKPEGIMLLQAITIADQRYEKARRSVDFIQRYIFPGGCLPSLAVVSQHVAEHSDMQIIGLEDITRHYAQTLAHWRERFWENEHQLTQQGYDEVFKRLWNYYFCYCEGGFRERVISTVQLLLAKPQLRELPAVGRSMEASP
jgi:cyclopropane-fatty-acyl-phospholipid synthase